MKLLALGAASLLVAATVLAAVPAAGQPAPVDRQSLVVEPQTGLDIYTHTTDSDYRLGPALLRFAGDTFYDFTCGPGPTGTGRVIRYAVSNDAGRTWSAEKIALQPSADSPDRFGVCDPAIAKVGSWFYLAYTGRGLSGINQLFVARAANVGGPWAKWNGTGWTGGTPAPIAAWVSEATGPSLVNRLGTLSLFYNDHLGSGSSAPGTYRTRVATADIGSGTDLDTWPARLHPDPGVAIDHPGSFIGGDCVGSHWWADTDVKYDEATDSFLAITSDQMSYRWSALQAYQSADGHHFTRTVITRGDYQAGARDPGQLADLYGHLTPNAPKAIGYAHTSGCGAADLRLTFTKQNSLTTGAVDEPLTDSATNWQPQSGTWTLVPGQFYAQTSTTSGAVLESNLGDRALSSSTSYSMRMRTADAGSHGWIGLHFAKAHPGDDVDQSGYTATLDRDPSPRVCLRKAGFGILACKDLTSDPYNDWVTLKVVQSGSGIKAYLNGDSGAGVAVTDADHPYLGGYAALATYSVAGAFTSFHAGDNVPETSTPADWARHSGSWSRTAHWLYDLANDGQLNMQTDQNLSSAVPSQFGDGTYAATLSLDAGADPDSWAGLAIANNDLTGSYASGGYLVFLRANGHLGLYKAGSGQVVADVPTGTFPTTTGVRVRVMKTGANFQVFVDDRPDPVVNWNDRSGHVWAIGSFGVANLSSRATFTDVTYNGDDAR